MKRHAGVAAATFMVLKLVAATNCMPSRSNTHPAKEKYFTPFVYQFPLRNHVRSVPRLRGAASLGRSCHERVRDINVAFSFLSLW
jgi:hypothetical protein